MIALLVILSIAAITLSIHMMNAYTSLGAQNLLVDSIKVKEELQMIKNSLLVLSTVYEETVDDSTIRYPALPMGQNQGDYHRLPAAMLKTLNPLKQPYVYCPFAARSDQPMTETISDGPGASYNAGTAVLTKNGTSRNYITSTGVNTLNGAVIMAYIISPTPSFKGSIRCSDVTYSDSLQQFVVAGGRVETITALEIEAVNLTTKPSE
ncbi:hypothetical protein ACNE9Y_30115 [Pseudomonas sp. NY11226]|uniref:hypothetical protein n=1 Tax=unclassified Pseudomonas TaxID=196821 RepID=UPI0031F6D421